MKICISNETSFTEAPESFDKEIRKRLTFLNPQWEANDKMSRWNGNTPRELQFFRENGNGLSIPRGFTGQLIRMAQRAGIPYHLDDQRRVRIAPSFMTTLISTSGC